MLLPPARCILLHSRLIAVHTLIYGLIAMTAATVIISDNGDDFYSDANFELDFDFDKSSTATAMTTTASTTTTTTTAAVTASWATTIASPHKSAMQPSAIFRPHTGNNDVNNKTHSHISGYSININNNNSNIMSISLANNFLNENPITNVSSRSNATLCTMPEGHNVSNNPPRQRRQLLLQNKNDLSPLTPLTINSNAAIAASSQRTTIESAAGTTTRTHDQCAHKPQQQERHLLRARRYLAFPEGATFTVAVCITVGIIGNPRYNYMSYGLNWGVAYDLPNTTWVLNNLHSVTRFLLPDAVLQRRSKRAIYQEIERSVDNMGYNGRDCVLRALCESRQYFRREKMNLVGELLRVIFSLPKQRLFTRELHENPGIDVYDHAYRKARSVDCAQAYDCSFSLLELAFGKYSNPPPGYYGSHGGQ